MSANPSRYPAPADAAHRIDHGIDPAEWDTLVKLAACYRMVARLGMDDLIYNHISARILGHQDQFLINPYGLLFDEISASSLVKINLDGEKLDDTPYSVNVAAFVIHAAIHASSHDAACVLHTHSDASVAVSGQQKGLLPLSQFAMRFYDRQAFHDYEGVAIDLDEQARLVRDLGPHKVMLMRNHGILTVGRTPGEAFMLLYYFERAARIQLQMQAAAAAGAALVMPPPEICEKAARQFWELQGDILVPGEREWPALMRQLDRTVHPIATDPHADTGRTNMLSRRHAFAAIVAAALAAGSLVQPAPAAELTKASLRLKWLPQAQFAGFYVALAKGYYKAEGIDLTINPGGPNLLTENLVATGADTFGLSGGTDSVFAARDKGLPIVCIGIAHQITPFVFVARKDGPVKTLQDFKGKTVTTWFTGANHVLNGMLAKEGFKPDEVKIQPQQVSITPFVDGTVDVVTATYYNELYSIESRMPKDSLKIFVAEDYGITFPRDTLIVSETTAKEKPELVKAFLRASIKGWKDAFEDPKGAVDTVMAVAPTLDRAQQKFMLTEVKRLMTAGKAAQNGLFWIDPDAVKTAHDFLLKYGVISKPVDLAAAYDASFIESVPIADRRP